MSRGTIAAGLAIALFASAAHAQLTSSNDPDRRARSGAAATRGIALCSGLWDGNQTKAMIDRDSPGREGLSEVVDHENRVVAITYDEAMPPRYVVWRPVLGCTQLPPGASLDQARYLPQVGLTRPNFDDQAWPTGDADARGSLPAATQGALDALVEQAFDGETYGGRTWGVVVVKDGKIVAERYAMDFDMHTAAQTHSAAKSFASTVVGIAVDRYGYDVHAAPAIAAWRDPVDPRRGINGEILLRMTGGFAAGAESPQQDIYSGGATVEGRANSMYLDAMPGTRFLYNPPETMLVVRSVREHIGNDAAFWALPFTELFWKIGMTRTTPSSDWNGDFLMSGQTYSTARDFARFGLLYLNEGEWMGEQIVSPDWAEYVRTPGPVQPAAGNGYGAQFWLYGGRDGLPEVAYSPAGGQGQYAVIIPSENLVVVRRGYDAGGGFAITRFAADVVGVLD